MSGTMNRVFPDANILIDYLSDRANEENELNARLIVEYCFEYLGKAYVFTHSIMILYHMVQKEFAEIAVLKERLEEVCQLFNIITVQQQDFTSAFNSMMTDFEDAVQLSCALEAKADILITRNVDDFYETNLPIIPPEQFFDFI